MLLPSSISAPQSLLYWLTNYNFSPWQSFGIGAGVLTSCGLLLLLKKLYIDPNLSPIKDLPGPPGYDSIMWGHLQKIIAAPTSETHQEWILKYGRTFQYRGPLLTRRVCTIDTRAVTHILNHSIDYPKPPQVRGSVERVFGKGLLFAEGEAHRRQRRIMNPCFGIAQVRDLMPIFYDKAYHLRDMWSQQVTEDESRDIDVLSWLTRTTLDVIGAAGFDYEFNSLDEGETNELAQAFNAVFSVRVRATIVEFLQNRFPFFRLIPTEQGRNVARSTKVMDRIGQSLLKEKKAAVLQAAGDKASPRRDILSMLVMANMAQDSNESQGMSDEEVLAQISTFLIAGHETTSATVTWLLYTLASSEEGIRIQQKLRAELWSVKSDRPTMEELNALPYLEAVVRENLRVNSVVPATVRVAAKDDVIPLSEPVVDIKGLERNQLRVRKGDAIFIPILPLHRDKKLWGEDALTFRPERWLEGGMPTDIPGVFAGLMTFIGGPRACIGYRFALMEMKVLIFILLREFTFEWSNPTFEVEPRSAIVARPLVKRPTGESKIEMPLRVAHIQPL